MSVEAGTACIRAVSEVSWAARSYSPDMVVGDKDHFPPFTTRFVTKMVRKS